VAELPAPRRLLLPPQVSPDLLAEGLHGVGLRDSAGELFVHRGQALLLESGQGDLVVHRLSREVLVGKIVRKGLPERPGLSDRGSRERIVDLGHRVGVPDLERDLLVPERARVLAGLQDLQEATRDVRDGVVAEELSAAGLTKNVLIRAIEGAEQ